MPEKPTEDPTEAYDILYGGFWGRMIELLNELVAIATDSTPDAESTRLCALTCLGQVMVFMAARTTTLRHMGWDKLEPEHLDAIRQQVSLNLHAMFTGDSPQ